ncbi:MAG TPA: Holliday junction branch migration protein RuvA [Chloroflexi bacterium]|nr:Holliday junction branch migration protein RuvA [Chloroflexota bacterium]
MIAFLEGTLAARHEDRLTVQIGAMGLWVFVPRPLAERLTVGQPVALHTHLVVREDALTLYGFETAEARDLFILLLGVNGVGPRLALAILSALTPAALRRAVFQEQADVFQRVPGVGKKTAQKIVLHLQDRLRPEDTLTAVAALPDADGEVLEALIALGYSVVEAQTAIQSLPGDAPPDVETRLRLALQSLSR